MNALIGEPQPEGNADPESRWLPAESVETLAAGPGRPRTPAWTWVFGTVVATSAVWALALHLSGYGQAPLPDIHHYRLSSSPCGGFNLKPLTDSFHARQVAVLPADTRTGPALDLAQCTLLAQDSLKGQWKVSYKTVVTVQLHKKTDPAPEFDDLNSPHGANQDAPASVVLDPSSGIATTGGALKSASPVAGLGDKAYLLSDDDYDETLTVLHGGAVFTIAVTVLEQWNGPDGAPPPDADGYPQKPPRINLRPALVATMRSVMSALSN